MRQVPRPGQGHPEVAGWPVAFAISICLWIIILKVFGLI